MLLSRAHPPAPTEKQLHNNPMDRNAWDGMRNQWETTPNSLQISTVLTASHYFIMSSELTICPTQKLSLIKKLIILRRFGAGPGQNTPIDPRFHVSSFDWHVENFLPGVNEILGTFRVPRDFGKHWEKTWSSPSTSSSAPVVCLPASQAECNQVTSDEPMWRKVLSKGKCQNWINSNLIKPRYFTNLENHKMECFPPEPLGWGQVDLT